MERFIEDSLMFIILGGAVAFTVAIDWWLCIGKSMRDAHADAGMEIVYLPIFIVGFILTSLVVWLILHVVNKLRS